MKEIENINKENFSLGFKGEDDIDLKELLNSLNGTFELIEYISKSIDNNSFVNVKVSGSRKGSFLVDLFIMAKEGVSLLNFQNISYAKLCIDTFCGILTLKKHLKGEKPKSVEVDSNGRYIVENKNCENIVVNNYILDIQGPECDRAIKKIFSNCNRPGIYVRKNNETVVDIEQSDFDIMTKNVGINEEENKENQVIINTSIVDVGIKKPDFTGKSKWELIYNNKIINSTIKDMSFIDKIHKGKIFVNGTTDLKVKLITEMQINEIGETIKRTYYVDEVIDINNKLNEQMHLNI